MTRSDGEFCLDAQGFRHELQIRSGTPRREELVPLHPLPRWSQTYAMSDEFNPGRLER
jgi:hypothetical protein